MGKTLLTRLAAGAAGGTLALTAAAPALAQDEHVVDLRQSNVTADDPEFNQGFGECVEKPDQGEDEDIWVFVWPGNQVEELVSLTLNFDSDGDDTADTTLTEADANETLDQGTLKVWVATPAGWTLIDGTSEVVGSVPRDKFNLTHSCAGEEGGNGKTPPPTTPPPGNGGTPPPGEGENGEGGEDGEDEDELPVTGLQVGGLAVIGAGLLAAGVALMAIRRRNGLADLTEE